MNLVDRPGYPLDVRPTLLLLQTMSLFTIKPVPSDSRDKKDKALPENQLYPCQKQDGIYNTIKPKISEP